MFAWLTHDRVVRWGMTLLGEHDHTRLYKLD